MSERSRPCQKRQWIAAKRFFGLRACFTLEVKHTLTFICGGRGLKWGVQWVGPQGVLQSEEGMGFGSRRAEGMRGRVRACFTLTPNLNQLLDNSK